MTNEELNEKVKRIKKLKKQVKAINDGAIFVVIKDQDDYYGESYDKEKVDSIFDEIQEVIETTNDVNLYRELYHLIAKLDDIRISFVDEETHKEIDEKFMNYFDEFTFDDTTNIKLIEILYKYSEFKKIDLICKLLSNNQPKYLNILNKEFDEKFSDKLKEELIRQKKYNKVALIYLSQNTEKELFEFYKKYTPYVLINFYNLVISNMKDQETYKEVLAYIFDNESKFKKLDYFEHEFLVSYYRIVNEPSFSEEIRLEAALRILKKNDDIDLLINLNNFEIASKPETRSKIIRIAKKYEDLKLAYKFFFLNSYSSVINEILKHDVDNPYFFTSDLFFYETILVLLLNDSKALTIDDKDEIVNKFHNKIKKEYLENIKATEKDLALMRKNFVKILNKKVDGSLKADDYYRYENVAEVIVDTELVNRAITLDKNKDFAEFYYIWNVRNNKFCECLMNFRKQKLLNK